MEKVPFLVRKKQLWYNKVPVSGRGIMMNLNFKMIEKYGKDGLFAWKMLHRAFSVGKRLFFGRKRKQKRQGKQRQKKRLVVDVPVFCVGLSIVRQCEERNGWGGQCWLSKTDIFN